MSLLQSTQSLDNMDIGGGGDLRMDLRRASDLAWVGSATSAANPKSMTANVHAGVTIRSRCGPSPELVISAPPAVAPQGPQF